MQSHRNQRPKLVSLGTVLVALGLFAGQPASANPNERLTQPTSLQTARDAMKAGHSERAVALLRKVLEREQRSLVLDEISRLFEALGWFRDARIVSDRLTQKTSAPPVLRLLHAARSKMLRSKEKDAFLRLPTGRSWSVRTVNGDRIPSEKHTVEIPTDEASYVELASADGTELWIRRVQGRPSRRIDLALQPSACVVSSARIWRSLQLENTQTHTPLENVKSIHLPAGKHTLQVTVDEGEPLTLVTQESNGTCVDLDKDLRAAQRLRDVRVSTEMSVRNQPGPYVATATGALLAGIGWTLLVLAEEKRDSPGSLEHSNTLETMGGVTLGTGIAAGATGLVWYLINMARGRKAARAISASPPSRTQGD